MFFEIIYHINYYIFVFINYAICEAYARGKI